MIEAWVDAFIDKSYGSWVILDEVENEKVGVVIVDVFGVFDVSVGIQ